MLGFTSATTPQVTGAEQTSNLKIIHLKKFIQIKEITSKKSVHLFSFSLSPPFSEIIAVEYVCTLSE